MKYAGPSSGARIRLKKSIVPFLCALTILSCTLSAEERGMAVQQKEALLKFRLEVQESYEAGQAVNVGFKLENPSERELYVLTWYTPLEGVRGKIFKVTLNGKEIRYEGRMVKRGDPSRKDYARIGPRESVSAKIDLSRAYNLREIGEYQLEFVGRIHDVVYEPEMLPRARGEHKGMDASGDSVSFRVVQP